MKGQIIPEIVLQLKTKKRICLIQKTAVLLIFFARRGPSSVCLNVKIAMCPSFGWMSNSAVQYLIAVLITPTDGQKCLDFCFRTRVENPIKSKPRELVFPLLVHVIMFVVVIISFVLVPPGVLPFLSPS